MKKFPWFSYPYPLRKRRNRERRGRLCNTKGKLENREKKGAYLWQRNILSVMEMAMGPK